MGSTDSPGVRVAPPLYYAAGIAVGLIITHYIPTRWFPPAPVAPWLGGILIAIGAGLPLSAITLFRRTETTIRPDRSVSSLVIAGPYRFTRNPMYLGLAVVYTGIALVFQSVWALVLLPIVLAIIQRTVISREEAYLQRRFGPEYDRYRSQVPRWL